MVRNVDATLAWEARSEVEVEVSDGASSGFQAVANALAVGCGGGCGVKTLNPAAAGWRHSASTGARHIWYARLKRACHLATCDGSLGNGRTHHHAH